MGVAGGAPSRATAEVYCMMIPASCAAQNEVEDASMGSTCGKLLTNMNEGRMGCQAIVIKLPINSSSSSSRGHTCAIVVGGERYEEAGAVFTLPSAQQLSTTAAYDLDTNAWHEK